MIAGYVSFHTELLLSQGLTPQFHLQVPLWDMLNHVTGICNVRLHHDATHQVLQMIATKPIKQGEELINNYGPLSDAELFRRFGFIECEANPNNGCEVPFAMVLAECQKHLLPVEVKKPGPDTANSDPECNQNSVVIKHKIHFMLKHGIVPSDGWFKADILGQPQNELIEAVRLLLLHPADFKAFQKQVETWRCPMARPSTHLTSISPQVPQVIHKVAGERLARLAEPTRSQAGASQNSRQTAAQLVLITERRALLCMQLWIDKHDSSCFIKCCKEVWIHPR